MKKFKEWVETDIKTLDSLEWSTKTEAGDLLKTAKDYLKGIQTILDERLATILKQEDIPDTVNLLTEETDIIRKLNIAETRLWLPNTETPVRKISSWQAPEIQSI